MQQVHYSLFCLDSASKEANLKFFTLLFIFFHHIQEKLEEICTNKEPAFLTPISQRIPCHSSPIVNPLKRWSLRFVHHMGITAYNIQMKFLQRDSSSKRPYAKISIQKREQLVKNVMDECLPISKIAKKLRIKISTARLIIRKYKESGLFYAKQFKPRPSRQAPRSPSPQKQKNSNENSLQDCQQQLRIEQQQFLNAQEKEEQQIFQVNPFFFYYVPAWHPLPLYF